MREGWTLGEAALRRGKASAWSDSLEGEPGQGPAWAIHAGSSQLAPAMPPCSPFLNCTVSSPSVCGPQASAYIRHPKM
jgi:hypothetical protein